MAKGQAKARSGMEQLVYEIGQRLGMAMVEGLKQGMASQKGAAAAAPVARRKPGRPRKDDSSESDCPVPHCGRKAVAKGLCPTHYRKARRLGLPESLSKEQLGTLAEDGRKTRFSA